MTFAHLPHRLLHAVYLSLLLGLVSLPVPAQSWPAKPLRWVVAYPAGGGSDFLARQLAPPLGKMLGQPIVIDNRPGAAGIIGTEHAVKSPADGYTLVTGDNGAMVFHGAMRKSLPYDPQDLAPVGFMARFPLILAVNPDSGLAGARQLIDAIKTNPAKYSYASPGVGSPHHLAMELLLDRTRSTLLHVPYRGTAPALQDLIGGQVPIAVLDTAAGLPQIRAGKVRALAVLSKKRLSTLPDVPTLDEIGRDLGLKDFEVSAWQALFVPRGTPGEIVVKLGAAMSSTIRQPELRQRLEDYGLDVMPTDGPGLAKFIDEETKFWHALIKARGLTAE
jgi:tripartite-type tricarboxylate transporter receptor subunit TctC